MVRVFAVFQGPLPIDLSLGVRQRADAGAAVSGVPCRPDAPATVPALFTRRVGIAPELLYLTAKLAALMPFGKVAAFLGEVLPLSTTTHASTVQTASTRRETTAARSSRPGPSADALR